MIMEDISVIIPTWNREKTLRKAIQSVLNQTIHPLEILVCDDGSTDNTFKVIKSLNNSKVKWIAEKHSGLPAVVRNRGIKESKGEWIAFLDSDDEWHPEKIEKQLAFIKKTGYLAICSNAYNINSKGERKKYLNYSKNTITFSDLLNVNYVILSSAIIHKSILSKCVGFPEILELKTGQDYAFWLRVATQTNFIYLNKILVNYNNDPKNSIRKFTKDTYKQKQIILKDFLRWAWKNKILISYLVKAIAEYILILTKKIKNNLREKLNK